VLAVPARIWSIPPDGAAHLRPDHGIGGAGSICCSAITGLLSFGHSGPYFGAGAYTLRSSYATSARNRWSSASSAGSGHAAHLGAFGSSAYGNTRIFFSILTLAFVAGVVEPCLQVLLGDRRHRRHPRRLCQAHAVRRVSSLAGPAPFQRFVFATIIMYLDCSRWRRSSCGSSCIRRRQKRCRQFAITRARELRRHISAAYRWIAFVISARSRAWPVSSGFAHD